MAKRVQATTKYRVRTPITTDGVELDLDDDGKVQYKETLIPANKVTLRELESANAGLPKNLQYKWEEVNADGSSLKKAEAEETTTKGRKKSTDE